MGLRINNFDVDLYFGSVNINDNKEHLYYQLTFRNNDNLPLAVVKMSEAVYDELLDGMLYLPENLNFVVDFSPSEPLVNYTIWAEYVTDEDDYELTNIFTMEEVNKRTLPNYKDAYIHIMLCKTVYPSINETVLLDAKLTPDEYYQFWSYMNGNWWATNAS